MHALFLSALVIILVLGTSHAAWADTHTWDGGSGTDDNWSSGDNWVGDTAPVSGDSLVFTGTVRPSPVNDLAGLSLASVSFTHTGFYISGNPVTLTGGMTQSAGTALNQWNIDMSLPAGTHTFTGNAADLTLFGVISGAGGVSVDGDGGAVGLGGLNTYSGGTEVVDNGWLFLRENDAIPHGAGKGGLFIDTDATVDLNTYSAAINGLTGDGLVGVDVAVPGPAPANTLTVGDSSNSEFSGEIQDGRATLTLVKVGSGTQTLSGPCSYTGPTTVSAGTLSLESLGSISDDSAVTVHTGAKLGGIGSAEGTVTVDGAIAPGTFADAIGTLHTGSEKWDEGGSYEFQVAAADGTPGTDWDLLDISEDFTLAASDRFTIKLASVGALADFDPSAEYVWRIANFTGDSNQFDSRKFMVDTAGFAPDLEGGTFSVVQAGSGQAIDLVFAPAPTFYTVHFNTDGTTGSSVSSMTQAVAEGGSAQPVTASAPVGHHFTQWTGTGAFATTTDNPVAVTGVSAEMTVTAHFAVDTFTITALTSANGTITPTSQNVSYDSTSTSLTITPNAGYHFVSAADKDGAITTVPGSVAGTRQYKFTHVTANNTITAVFSVDTFTITALTSANGTITPTSQAVNYDSTSTSLTITPNAGYHFVSAADKDGAITTVPGTVAGTRQYKFTHVTANNTITAVFARNTFTLAYSANPGGSIVGSETQVVNQNASGSQVLATPNPGYHFVIWSDGVLTDARTDTDVTANHTFTATFAADRPAAPYSVTWSPVKGGTLIQWAGSPGATGYQVWLGTAPIELGALGTWNPGRLLGTTGPTTCYLFVPEYLGPSSTIYVVALGSPMNSLPGTGVYSASVTPVQMGTVRFNGNSSKLTPAAKRALRSYASLMAAQGFTSLKVSGYTAARDHGSKGFRRRLSLKRAKIVKAYLAAQFRTLHANVTITTAGYGGTNPVASNRSAWGMARNRRAELLLK